MRLKQDGNPEKNVGAIFEKCSPKDSYYIIKVTLAGTNHTLVAFRNPNHSGEEFSKEPLYFLFPYRPKQKNNNNNYEES